MVNLRDILLGAALPAAVTAAVWLLLVLAPLGRHSPRRWAAPVAIVCGYLAGHLTLAGCEALLGRMVEDRLTWLAAGGVLVIGTLAAARSGHARLGIVRTLVVAALAVTSALAAAATLLWPQLPSAWTGQDDPMAEFGFTTSATLSAPVAAGWLAATTTVLAVIMFLATRPPGSRPDGTPPPAWSAAFEALMLSGATALTLGLCGSQSLAQLAGVLAASVGGWTLVSVLPGRLTAASNDAATTGTVGATLACTGVMIAAALLLGRVYASLTAWPGGLLLAATLVVILRPAALNACTSRRLARIAVVLTLTGAAVVVAALKFAAENRSPSLY